MDIDKMIYRTWEDLSLYCFRVAGVVGLMMCHIMSLRDETKLDKAVQLGQAMQLTNICRDIKEDEQMGRCYIPQEILEKHRIAQASTKTRSDRERLFPAVIDLLDRAEASYEEAWLGLPYLPFKASLCIAIAMELYRGIGKKILTIGPEALNQRVWLSGSHKTSLVLKTMIRFFFASPWWKTLFTWGRRPLIRTLWKGKDRCYS